MVGGKRSSEMGTTMAQRVFTHEHRVISTDMMMWLKATGEVDRNLMRKLLKLPLSKIVVMVI